MEMRGYFHSAQNGITQSRKGAKIPGDARSHFASVAIPLRLCVMLCPRQRRKTQRAWRGHSRNQTGESRKTQAKASAIFLSSIFLSFPFLVAQAFR